MDFSTAHGGPVIVNIDGARHEVPRFRLPHFKAWGAQRAKATRDEALAQFENAEQRARFLMYWTEPLFDVADIAEELRTPAGVVHVLETCLAAASPPVPAETVAKLIDFGNAYELRVLAGQLAGVDRAIAQLREQSGDEGKKSDPTNAPKPTSADVQQTGESGTPDSAGPSERAPKTE